MAKALIPLSVRFWAKVQKTDYCWNWTGAILPDGVGHIFVSYKNGHSRPKSVHRISWELHFGKIPDGLCVLHRCDNPKCVRPDHLFLGTQLDNIRDRDAKERTKGRHFINTNMLTIYARYVAGGISQQALADQYNVSRTVIRRIIRLGKT